MKCCDNPPLFLLPNFPIHLTLAVILCFLAIFTVLLNLLFLISSYCFTKSRTISDTLYMMLAMTDFITGLVVMTSFSYELFYFSIKKDINCINWVFVKVSGYSFATWSIATVAAISCELYLSVVHPFFYQEKVNKTKILAVLFIIYACYITAPVTTRVISSEIFDRYRETMAIICIPVVMFMGLTLLKTYFTINNMITRVRGQDFNETLMLSSKKKLLIMATMVLLTFTICFMPVAVTSIYILYTKRTVELESYVVPIVEIIALANSFFDPFVYYFRLGKVRKNIKRLFKLGNKNTGLSSSLYGTSCAMSPRLNTGNTNNNYISGNYQKKDDEENFRSILHVKRKH